MPELGPDEEAAVLAVLRSGWLSTGHHAAAFEEALRAEVGAGAVVAVNSGTSALHLALVAGGVAPGDEVVTTPITWPATANVVVHAGADPVFADIDRDTLNLDPAAAATAVTARTTGLLPVDLAGQPAELSPLRTLARRHGLLFVEDAAHSLGARYDGRPVGSLAAYTCFSFYATKAITTGEGGAVAVADSGDAARVRLLSRHGMTASAWDRAADRAPTPECVEAGFKDNLPDLLAVIGSVQLRRLESFLHRRAVLAALYREGFADVPAIRLPGEIANVRHAHHLFPILVRPERSALDRDTLAAALDRAGISTGVHYRGLHLQPYYAQRYGWRPEDLPVATEVSRTVLSLPLYPSLSPSEVLRVVETVTGLVSGSGGS